MRNTVRTLLCTTWRKWRFFAAVVLYLVPANVDPGQPFPANPLAVVNSPVDVTVNGTSAEVLAAVGYPGSVDGYQVNLRVPDGLGHGTAQLQLSAAWITSSAVTISIQ